MELNDIVFANADTIENGQVKMTMEMILDKIVALAESQSAIGLMKKPIAITKPIQSSAATQKMNKPSLAIHVDGMQVKSNKMAMKVNAGHFYKIARLGEGSCGKVYLVQSKGLENDGIFAMKVVDKGMMLEKEKVTRMMNEKDILCTADHPFIVTLHHAFQSEKYLYFIMQHCAGGDLFSLLKSQPGRHVNESMAKFYAAEVLLALEYLHVMGFIYRDLKPENILVHESGHLMLSDFDLSKQQPAQPLQLSPTKRASVFNSANTIQQRKIGKGGICSCFSKLFSKSYPTIDTETHLKSGNRLNSFVGTPEYIAPEVIAEEGYYGSVDWWAFGVLLYEMLYSDAPFRGNSSIEIFEKILCENEKLPFPPHVAVSSAAKDLLRRLLHKDVSKRLSNALAIKQHPFFKDMDWALIRSKKPPLIPKISRYAYLNSAKTYVAGDESDDEVLPHPSSPKRNSPVKPKRPSQHLVDNQEQFAGLEYEKSKTDSIHWKDENASQVLQAIPGTQEVEN